MKITLIGSDRYSAVEQAALNFFPDKIDGEAIVTVKKGTVWTSASAFITIDERTEKAYYRIKTENKPIDFLLKQVFFKAARPYFESPPPWGSLTGIRPAKLTAMLIQDGLDPEKVLREKYFVTPKRRKLAIECAQNTLKAKAALDANDIALYVGIPFCPSRCAYCSFVSSDVEKSKHLIEPYIERLISEIELMGQFARRQRLKVVSVYVGGGTPTILSADQLNLLCKAINDNFERDNIKEFTVEAGRPDTITEEKLTAMRSEGVTRISINPQTTNPEILENIGRKHTAEQTIQAFDLAENTGFACVNADIIAGLPGDTTAGFEKTLDDVLNRHTENITVHTLSLKKGAKLFSRDNPYGQDVENMLSLAEDKLRRAGYSPYYLYRQKYMAGGFENVGWCLPGTENLYNICMMEEVTSVLSVGAGGVSKLVNPKLNRIERVCHCKFPLEYLQDTGRALRNILDIESFFKRI